MGAPSIHPAPVSKSFGLFCFCRSQVSALSASTSKQRRSLKGSQAVQGPTLSPSTSEQNPSVQLCSSALSASSKQRLFLLKVIRLCKSNPSASASKQNLSKTVQRPVSFYLQPCQTLPENRVSVKGSRTVQDPALSIQPLSNLPVKASPAVRS